MSDQTGKSPLPRICLYKVFSVFQYRTKFTTLFTFWSTVIGTYSSSKMTTLKAGVVGYEMHAVL